MNASTSDRPARSFAAKVLVAVDRSPASRHAIAYARQMIAPGGVVRLISVAENPRTLIPAGPYTRDALDSARAELLADANDALAEARNAFAGCEVQLEAETVDLSKHGGDVAHALLEIAHSWPADLIVVGARQHHGLLRWVEGSISGPLAQEAPCPILIVPAAYTAEAGHVPERFLFAVDGSPQATAALHYGLRFAAGDASLRAVYVIDRTVRLSDLVPIDSLEDIFVDEGMNALAAAEPILARTSRQTSTALVETERSRDDVAHAIVREANNWTADLIVMGTHGRSGVVRWMLGSVAERVAGLTQTPLLLVHAHPTTH